MLVTLMGATDSKPGAPKAASKSKQKESEAAAEAKVDAYAKELEEAHKAAAMQDMIAQQQLEMLKAEMRLNEQLAQLEEEEAMQGRDGGRAGLASPAGALAGSAHRAGAAAADSGTADDDDLGELDEDERAALEAELEELEKADESGHLSEAGGDSGGPGGALAG